MTGQQEATPMIQDKSMNVNWLTVNVPSVVSILLVGIGVAMYIQALRSDVEELRRNTAARATLVDKVLDQVATKLAALDTIPYRTDSLERSLISTNQRMDNYLQTLGIKLDGVSDRVNGLSTKVEVLGQKIDTILPVKPSVFRPGAL